MNHTVEVSEEQRQLILLGLALLSLDRPGWLYALHEAAGRFPGGVEMYEQFRVIGGNDLAMRVGKNPEKLNENKT